MSTAAVRSIVPALIFLLSTALVTESRNASPGRSRVAEPRSLRSRRNAANFGMMIMCATGRNPLDYIGYGCWCGKGGKGIAVDAVDECCRQHDLCWSKARRMGCGYGLWTEYGKWQCLESRPVGCGRSVHRIHQNRLLQAVVRSSL